MAKIEIRHIDLFEREDYISVEMVEYGIEEENNRQDNICVCFSERGRESMIVFDKSTAIKFAKTLRTEINKIKV